MAPRKSNGNPRRDDPKPRAGGKSGGLLTGLFIGLVVGLIAAAGLAWYFNSKTPTAEQEESIPPETEVRKKPERPTKPVQNKTPPVKTTAPEKVATTVETTAEPTAKATSAQTQNANLDLAADAAPSAIKPRVDYTFYGILPGDKPAKPIPPPESKDIWWLQVAALKSPADADKLKARLTLLGLQVATQKVESGEIPLYRVRVGPYKREDDALGDLDTLAANNFEPRLFKEPNPPAAAPIAKEKP